MELYHAILSIDYFFPIKKYVLLDDFALGFQERNEWLEGFILQPTFVKIIRWSIRCGLQIWFKQKSNIEIKKFIRTNLSFRKHFN